MPFLDDPALSQTVLENLPVGVYPRDHFHQVQYLPNDDAAPDAEASPGKKTANPPGNPKDTLSGEAGKRLKFSEEQDNHEQKNRGWLGASPEKVRLHSCYWLRKVTLVTCKLRPVGAIWSFPGWAQRNRPAVRSGNSGDGSVNVCAYQA